MKAKSLNNNIRLGRAGEDQAETFLCGLGYRLVDRSYRTRLGEIDLIMRDGEALVFIEVKTRSGDRYGEPEESVHYAKQSRILRAAMAYLGEHRLQNVPIRFDVVSISPAGTRHFKSAFFAAGFGY